MKEMRRKSQRLNEAEVQQLLEQGSSGVLALVDETGYPYTVPLSYLYFEGKLYFHSALSGHKIEAISACDKASFCLISQDDVVPKKLTTAYRSVIAFGKVSLIENPEEKYRILTKLAEKYAPGMTSLHESEAKTYLHKTAVIEFVIEHVSGKQGKELMG